MQKAKSLGLFLLLSALFSALCFSQTSAAAPSQLPRLMRFNGTTSSQSSIVGVTFSLYATDQGGTPLWMETQNVSVDATGHYSVLLGSASKDGLPAEFFASNEARWLGVKMGDSPEQARVLLVSVPYALKAGDAETLGGLPAAAFIQNPDVIATLASGSTATTSSATSTSYVNSRAIKAAITGALGGTGTAGNLARWADGSGNLGNSIIYDTGSKIGVNNGGPIGFLDVATDGAAGYIALTPYHINLYDKGFLVRAARGAPGSPAAVQNGDNLFNLYAQGYYGTDFGIAGGIAMTVDGNPTAGGIVPGRLLFYTSSPTANFLERMRIDSQGRVGIGTSAPTSSLTVAGNIESTTDNGAGYIIMTPSNINLYDKGFLVRASRGAKSAPTAVQNGDNLFNLYAQGLDTGSNYQIASGIAMGVDGTVASGVMPGHIQFYTSGTGAGTIFQERMRIDSQGRVGIGTSAPDQTLTVSGMIHSSGSGGFMFPDGSVLTSATMPTVTGSTTYNGTTANQILYAVQNQVGNSSGFNASGVPSGLRGDSTTATGYAAGVFGSAASPLAPGVAGVNTSSCSGPSSSCDAYGVFGWSVQAASGVGVWGQADATASANNVGVYGQAKGDDGTGVFGYASSTTAFNQNNPYYPTGVFGQTDNPAGNGVWGYAKSTTGNTVGVYGQIGSSSGIAGLFDAPANGTILEGRVGDPGTTPTKVFHVTAAGDFYGHTFNPGGADFAEAVDAIGGSSRYEPGDVMMIDETGTRRLTLASEPYSTKVAGIYSTQPGVLASEHQLDDPRISKEVPLAIVGIVPCKVSAENGAIHAGDLLVTSSIPGFAMKGTDRNRMLGAIVGKALGSLDQGAGTIEVLVSLH
jgi:hypothetical protein